MDHFKKSKYSFIKSIQKAGGQVFAVGGNVRDYYLEKPVKDDDLLITKLPINQLTKILSPLGTTNLVGKSFGIIKFRPYDYPEIEFDLSLPRLEKSTGIKHTDFDVEFDPFIPVKQDLGRRDFTINAMAFDIGEEKLIDPFNGFKDLKNKIIRQVFENTFIEDPLRLLRAIQFAARFNFQIEDKTFSAIKENHHLIKTVSKERIIAEIKKLFLAKKPSLGFDLMRETGLLEIIFPFLQKCIGVSQPNKDNEDVYTHTMKVLDASRSAIELTHPGDIDVMFAALLHDIGKPKTKKFDKEKNLVTFYGHQNVSKGIAKEWLNQYRATTIGVNIGKVLNLIKNHMFETKSFYSDKAIRRFINKVGVHHIGPLLDLRIADKKGGRFPDALKGIMKLRDKINHELELKSAISINDLAIDGHDLMSLGLKPGPKFGDIQRYLLELVLDEPDLNHKDKLLEIVKMKFINEE